MDEDLLISLVEKYPELYDQEDSKYHDDQRRMTAWGEIANYMELSPVQCAQRWKRIRDNFRRAHQLRKNKVEQGQKCSKPIKFGKQLEFLLPFIRESVATDYSTAIEPVIKNVRTLSDKRVKKRIKIEEKNLPCITSHRMYERTSVVEVVQEDEDPTVNFFKNLGETVKDFPPELRVRVKREVFNIVSVAEEQCIERYDHTVVNVTQECDETVGLDDDDDEIDDKTVDGYDLTIEG